MSGRACTACSESLDGDPIEGIAGRYQDLRIPIELTYKFRNIVVIWRCPFCGHGWPRFDTGPMHDGAVAHLRSDTQTGYERRPQADDPVSRRPPPAELPDIDDRPVAKVPGVPLEGQRPRPRRGVQRAGARTGSPRRR